MFDCLSQSLLLLAPLIMALLRYGAYFALTIGRRSTDIVHAQTSPDFQVDNSGWNPTSWAAGDDARARHAVEVLALPGSDCLEVRKTALFVASRGGVSTGLSTAAVVNIIRELAEQLQVDTEKVPYWALFAETAAAVRVALEVVQLLSLGAMLHKACFQSAARHAMGSALIPLQITLNKQIATMWWMFDIGQFSNTMSPRKHFEAIHSSLQQLELLFSELYANLSPAVESQEVFWGHEEHGMFMNSTVIYRKMFPESALLDKGLLRFLIRQVVPADATLGDFGALDGQYAKWLNDTGLVTAFAFDGVQGVTELTDGIVSQVDLATELHIHWHPEPFDWVMCLEVAEHIPPEEERVFLANLNRHARSGMVVSWAPPEIEGEGHVNCVPKEESRRRIEALGFRQDEGATASLRAAAHIPWIAASVAVYRRI
eukprot:TRINITY_DN122711_c0_g1_i1.p1 TRINITY_DN122711_c0_g1~~TRINITY_DN122711_c0_g1_i1.p1  ORF type:complete len:429 (-),score=26.41 TRINITY_DN122711_c0_g1_i1:391-1677(-)